MKRLTPEMLYETKRLARDIRRDATQDEVFPLSESMQSTLDAVVCLWEGNPRDIKDADEAAAKWIAADGMDYTAAQGSTVGGSTLVAAKAFLIERLLGEQAYIVEVISVLRT